MPQQRGDIKYNVILGKGGVLGQGKVSGVINLEGVGNTIDIIFGVLFTRERIVYFVINQNLINLK